MDFLKDLQKNIETFFKIFYVVILLNLCILCHARK